MKDTYDRWRCVENCGACCRLAPEERLEAIEALDPKQTEIYLKMVDENGWCINYEKHSRTCRIYENRPNFCKIASLSTLFKSTTDNTATFAIECCREHINSVYGSNSQEKRNFESGIIEFNNSFSKVHVK